MEQTKPANYRCDCGQLLPYAHPCLCYPPSGSDTKQSPASGAEAGCVDPERVRAAKERAREVLEEISLTLEQAAVTPAEQVRLRDVCGLAETLLDICIRGQAGDIRLD